MKAYPLIYSRTKYVDFVPDFLVRPEKLDYIYANRFTRTAMSDLDMIKKIRYSVYHVEKYICIGIAGCTRIIVETIKSQNSNYLNRHPDIDEYLKDTKGRKTNCFIGVAIPVSEIPRNKIPDITLEEYMDMYLDYLKHQWNNEDKTESETLKEAPLDIRERDYIPSFNIDFEMVGEKKIVKNYESNENAVIAHFFHMISEGKNESFVTDINDRNEWNNMLFTSAVVDKNLLPSLKSNPIIQKRESASKLKRVDDEVIIKRTAVAPPPETTQFKAEDTKKKTSSSLMLAAAAAIVIAIILLIVIL